MVLNVYGLLGTGLFYFGGFLLHISYWLHFYLGCSYTSHAGLPLTHSRALFNFIWGVSLTHPMLTCFYVGSFSYTSRVALIFMWEFGVTHPCWFLFFIFISGVSLTHPILTSFVSTLRFCGEFLLHIPRWLFLCGKFLLLCGVSSFLSWEFLLEIPCWLHFYVWSSSYTSHADFVFMWGVSVTHPVLVPFFYILLFKVNMVLNVHRNRTAY